MKAATLLVVFAPAILAAPIVNREAAPDAAPQDYGSYGTYAPPAGGYGTYDDYPSTPAAPIPTPVPAPAGGYGSYGTYAPPAGGYGSYGTYKRAVDWVKGLFA